ncbi:ATP-binding protein [Segeticoccus rhizosphaerae]|uniref:ATP-binding protein n=1 Tax=Segeticoccus rhizosphaerae TaxID=1104777 RepID=UPI00126490FE|nr:ATP-binding protein [Segeticoccus rhizosphaerae]
MIRLAELRSISLFDGLSDVQLAELLAAGTEVPFEPGDELFQEGGHADFWWVVVDGALDLYRRVGREEALVGKMDVPGRWSGGFRAWDDQAVYLATGRAVIPGRLLRVPAESLRERFNAWFPFGVHLVAGLYGTARRIESTVRQRQSLITLGTLAAGLAHEINNPAAAATRAVSGLEETAGTLLECLGQLARGQISATQFIELDNLRREIEKPPATIDRLELADKEEELGSWMAGHQVDRPWELAASLAAAGADRAWCERAQETLGDSSLEQGLRWVSSALSMTALLGEMKESTRRVSELVAAVRSYSQMDRASRQTVDVTEGLDSTIVMLGHKIGDSITVVRDYAVDLPHIDAFPGELNQVWTNLIDNAVDAMEGAGTLRISARADGDGVIVEIGDTGPPMPPDVVARAFEAFYTTKDVGQGTGLGLDIARRIVVERHGGSITIDTGPAETVMRVRLPAGR